MSSDPSSIRFLSVDDHPRIRQGIAGLVDLARARIGEISDLK